MLALLFFPLGRMGEHPRKLLWLRYCREHFEAWGVILLCTSPGLSLFFFFSESERGPSFLARLFPRG